MAQELHEIQESKQSLWLLIAAPGLWAAHFLLCYLTASIWCAKIAAPNAPITTLRLVIVGYTVLALGAIAGIGWRGYQKHTFGRADLPHDEDTPEDRHRFLGFATLLLSILSAVAVIYAALVALFFRSCY